MNTERTSLGGSLTIWVSRMLVVLYVVVIVYPIVFVVLTSLKPTSEFYDNI
jgi:ABC-type glycerol-3-phosphate transport system permease component